MRNRMLAIVALSVFSVTWALAAEVSHFNSKGEYAEMSDNDGSSLYVSRSGTPSKPETYLEFQKEDFCNYGIGIFYCQGIVRYGTIPNHEFKVQGTQKASLNTSGTSLDGYSYGCYNGGYDWCDYYTSLKGTPFPVVLEWKKNSDALTRFQGTIETDYINYKIRSSGSSVSTSAFVSGTLDGLYLETSNGRIGKNKDRSITIIKNK